MRAPALSPHSLRRGDHRAGASLVVYLLGYVSERRLGTKAPLCAMRCTALPIPTHFESHRKFFLMHPRTRKKARSIHPGERREKQDRRGREAVGVGGWGGIAPGVANNNATRSELGGDGEAGVRRAGVVPVEGGDGRGSSLETDGAS